MQDSFQILKSLRPDIKQQIKNAQVWQETMLMFENLRIMWAFCGGVSALWGEFHGLKEA